MNRNIFLSDIEIFFETKNKKKEKNLDNYNFKIKIKNLIQFLKNNFFQKKLNFKKQNIGCGGSFSFIYNDSF
jgi:hypothetical protein